MASQDRHPDAACLVARSDSTPRRSAPVCLECRTPNPPLCHHARVRRHRDATKRARCTERIADQVLQELGKKDPIRGDHGLGTGEFQMQILGRSRRSNSCDKSPKADARLTSQLRLDRPGFESADIQQGVEQPRRVSWPAIGGVRARADPARSGEFLHDALIKWMACNGWRKSWLAVAKNRLLARWLVRLSRVPAPGVADARRSVMSRIAAATKCSAPSLNGDSLIPAGIRRRRHAVQQDRSPGPADLCVAALGCAADSPEVAPWRR